MGFFDIIHKVVDIVKGVIPTDSPVIQGIGSVASMVAHAIPGVGPIVDAAVPALNTIFGDGSSPSQPSSTPVNLLSQ
ncbi:hypothetical protein C8R44DRAFT_978477 [Mycena epipterygia]|nr:hypothetical protein C8R44DRAFT_978477 [Mycena epipterygia]